MIPQVALWAFVAAAFLGLGRQLIHLGWRGAWGDVSSFLYLTMLLYAGGWTLSSPRGNTLFWLCLLTLGRGAYLQDRRNRESRGRAA